MMMIRILVRVLRLTDIAMLDLLGQRALAAKKGVGLILGCVI